MPGFDLSIPASPTWTGLARDLVATSAVPLDLTSDRLSELLLLVNHGLSASVFSPDVERVRLKVDSSGDRVDVRITSDGARQPGPLSTMILDAVADRYRVEPEHGTLSFTFTA